MPKIQTLWPQIDQCLRENLVIISGHGSYYREQCAGSRLKIKQGVTVTLWQGLGEAMDDGTTGQWLDRGCTVTAFMKLRSQNKQVKTYQEGDILPNLILSPPGKLKIRDNRANDAQFVLPNFGHAVGGVAQGFIMQPDVVNVTQDVVSTSLFHIMKYALSTHLGNNFQWAACTSTITKRERWFVEKQSVDMVSVAQSLYKMTENDPGYAAWKPD